MLIAIRSEATNLLDEIKRLTKVNQDLKLKVETLESNSNSNQSTMNTPSTFTNKEVKENSNVQVIHPSSIRIETKNKSEYTKEMDFDSASIVPIDRIQAYKDAISEINSESKAIESSGVLFAMKKVVLACKSITEFIESKEGKRDLSLLKKDLSVALSKLMESAKNHVTVANTNSSHDIFIHSQQLTLVVIALANSIVISSSTSTEVSREPNDPVDIMEDYIHSPTPSYRGMGVVKNLEELKVL